tara:strand:- start:101 stop:2524 length:2424 start_codon:yes stop_codon:yes gene_type:complete
MAHSRISIALLFSVILLSPLINFDYKEEQIEQNNIVNELTELQESALTDARSSDVDIGWEIQLQSEGAGNEYGEAIVVDSSGNAYVSGVFCYDLKLGTIFLERIGICDLFLAKMSPNGYWLWANQIGGEDGYTTSQHHTLSLTSNGVFIGGASNSSEVTAGDVTMANSYPGIYQPFILKATTSGDFTWGQMISQDQYSIIYSVQDSSDGGAIVAGYFRSYSMNFGLHTISNSNVSQAEVFIAKIDNSGDWQWANSAGGNGEDAAYDMAINSDGLVSVVGEYNNQIQFGIHSLSSTFETQSFVSFISSDNGTWMGATNLEAELIRITGVSSFENGDFVITGFFGGSMSLGSTDLQSDVDQQDIFVSRISNNGSWIWAKSAEGNGQDCAFDVTIGSQDKVVIVGHFMSTSISFGNHYLYNTNSWEPDWDLYVAWLDSSGEWQGVIGATGSDMDKLKSVDIHTNGVVYVTGRTNSTSLVIGLDERSTSGYDDMFVALLDLDSDDDEIGDGRDKFPYESSQQSDRDNDGYGDNLWGYNGDRCPDDYTQWQDSDGDGFCDNPSGNNPDMCPNDWTQWQDSDGDGYCDDDWGDNPDEFPYDSTQWKDSDGDGYGDNLSGNNADDFPDDSTQYRDSDGDGYGDSAYGNNPDAFRNEPTQWKDGDEDGYGDNSNGIDGDFCLGTSSDERRDVDENGCGASQRDTDNDGVVDALDACDDSKDSSTANLEGCDAYQRDFDGDGLVDATDPCPDSVENLCLEATLGAGEKESSTEARLLWASLGLLILIAVLLLIMMFRKGKQGSSGPIIMRDFREWK